MVKERNVQAQFGQAADLYATSTVHARGADLGLAVQFARPQPEDVALDVSTGAGHMAMALAPHVARVMATDLTPQMLAAARCLATERELHNVEFQVADVRALPFRDGSFDIVTCRMAAHHYPRLEDAVREMARVLRPGGRLVVSDTMAPADEVADRFMNALETLRDPTHVRDWSVAEWRAAFSGVGLAVKTYEEIELELEFEPWVERSGTPAELRQVLTVMLTQAPPRLRELFAVKTHPLRFAFRLAVFLVINRPV